MNLDQQVGGREAPQAAYHQTAPWALALAPSFAAGLLLGFIAMIEGAPTFAALVSMASMTGLGAAIHFIGRARATRLWAGRADAAVQALRRLSKPTQLMLVAFVVTSVFAFELRFDLVPNRYGFLELILPIAVAAILFDASGGLFCAALTTTYAFQALVPPRFAPILENDVSWRISFFTFAAIALFTAIFFASQARPLFPQTGGELAEAAHAARQLRREMAASLRRSIARLKTHVLPGAALVLLYALVWATFATVSTGRGLHGDSLEAYAWGREFVLGYYKHPPFWSWVAGAWFAVMPRSSWSFWLLSELNGAIGLAGAWALIGRFGNRRLQMLGVLLLMLTPFYQFNAQRFNANTILLSLWPWTLYFFVRSMETRRLRHAVICGLLGGLAILSKYFGAILIATCFLAALTHDSRRRYFTSAAPYVSALVAFLVFLPHLVWLFRDGFQPLIYLSNRIDLADRAVASHYFEFIVGNIAFFILPSAVLLLVRWRKGRECNEPKIAAQHGASFLNVLAYGPFLLTLVAGTVGHAALGIPFAVPIFALIPLALIKLFMPDIDAAIRSARLSVTVLVGGCLLAAPLMPWLYMRFDPKHHSEPRQEMADAAIHLWHEHTGAQLRYVAGDRDFQLQIVFRSPDKTSEFNNFNVRWSPWVTPARIREHGLLAICAPQALECHEAAAFYMREDAKMSPVTLQREVWGAKGHPWTMNLYIIPPLAQR